MSRQIGSAKGLALQFGDHAISLLDSDAAVAYVHTAVRGPRTGCQQIMASGFHGMWSVASSTEVSDALRGVDLWLPDGIAPVAIARILGARRVARVPGPELFQAVLRSAGNLDRPLRHFLYGDTEETLTALRKRIEGAYPNNEIAGSISPPFTREIAFDALAVDSINSSRADILWVGLGTPKQDLWIARHKPHLSVPVAVAVGAAFRFETGIVPRAPEWLGRLGLEWIYRFAKEPRKLWRRVVLELPRFVIWVGVRLLAGGFELRTRPRAILR